MYTINSVAIFNTTISTGSNLIANAGRGHYSSVCPPHFLRIDVDDSHTCFGEHEGISMELSGPMCESLPLRTPSQTEKNKMEGGSGEQILRRDDSSMFGGARCDRSRMSKSVDIFSIRCH